MFELYLLLARLPTPLNIDIKNEFIKKKTGIP